MPLFRIRIPLGTALGLTLATFAWGDSLTFRHLGQKEQVQGNVLARYSDGTILLEGPDRQRYFIDPGDQIDWQEKGTAVKPWSREQLRAQLRKEFGADFHIQLTNHYAIVSNADAKLAQQAGTLLERAYAAFHAHFGSKGGFQFTPLPQPLVAVIFKTREEYLAATKEELGSTLAWSAGMYAQTTNRFYMFDAFGGNLEARGSVALSPERGVSPRSSSPLDPGSVEVIVHEGTHQLAFNLGLHLRHAANPVWFVEGLATYFEAADPKSVEGWARAGELNPGRLMHFQRIFGELPKGFLDVLVTQDELFYEPKTNGDAYAMSWALTYYLMRAKPTAYIRYARAVGARGLAPVDAKSRREDFRTAFQTTPAGLEDDFRRYMVGVMTAYQKSRSRDTAAR